MVVGVKKRSAQSLTWQPAWACSCNAANQRPSQTFTRGLTLPQFNAMLEPCSCSMQRTWVESSLHSVNWCVGVGFRVFMTYLLSVIVKVHYYII